MIKSLIFNKFFYCYKENLSVPYSVISYATIVLVVNGGNNNKKENVNVPLRIEPFRGLSGKLLLSTLRHLILIRCPTACRPMLL